MSLFEELKRRNVFRVGIAYVLLGWALLQGADFTLDLVGAPDWVIRALAVVVAIGLPIALFFAWAFELTPEGVKRESEVDRSASVTPQTGRRLDRLIIGVLVVVVAWFLFDELYLEPRERGEVRESTPTGPATPRSDATGDGQFVTKSIAVLPFADLSQNRDQDWFAEGLAEEILNALARAPDLLVASRTASFAYRDAENPIAEIGEALGVGHILEGSVRRAGDRVRVTAQLIRAEDGYHLWSQNYDRDLSDVISIQEDLAIAIARALETTMDPEALQAMLSVGTRSVDAYEHYLNGLSLEAHGWAEADFEARDAAYEAFEAARTVDPGFSSAHARAAQYWYRQVSISTRDITRPDLDLGQKMARFQERIQAAIRTAETPLRRTESEAILASAEGRLRDVVRLAGSVFEQRPLDRDNFTVLIDAAVMLADKSLLNRLVDHAWTLHDVNGDWAQPYLYYEWRIDGQPRNHEVFVDRVMALTRRYPQAGLLYQAHRTLLWIGETERAAELLPLLRQDIGRSEILMESRQACAEGRRDDVEALLDDLKSQESDWSPGDFASSRWHLEMMLGRPRQAAEALRPFDSTAAPMAVTNFTLYPQFDPTPFPVVMSILNRENVQRPDPIMPGFQCPAPGDDRQTVAVLPFRAMSSGEDDEYFADGLTEEILNALTQVPDLSVTSRTSSFYFRDRDLPITDIAEQLGVKHVVEGSVRRSGERLRITAQLIRAGDDTHLWSETFDSTSDDAIAVQEEIAQGIAEALGVFLDAQVLGLMRSAGLRDVTAFIEYQKGRKLHELAHGNEIMMELLEEGNEHLETALAIQPNFTPAWLFYSDYYTHLLLDHATGEGDRRLTQQEVAEALEAGRSAFQRAARAANNPSTRASAELDLAIYEGDGSAWRPLLGATLEADTCESVIWHQLVGFVPEFAQRFADAMRRLRACDPMTNRYSGMILSAYVWAGEPAKGLAVLAMDAPEPHAFHQEWNVRALTAQGKFPEAENSAVIDSTEERTRRHLQVMIAAAQGDRSRAEAADQAIRADADNRFLALQRAAWLGDRERANALASEIDSEALGHLSLMMTTYWCACGAPFDLEAAPNFAHAWNAAELPWPLEPPIDFPLKDW